MASPRPPSVTNNYGIDPNYGLGYVQIWNLDIQQEITRTLLINLDYTGTKGTQARRTHRSQFDRERSSRTRSSAVLLRGSGG